MIVAATRIGAATSGDWAGAHSVQWDAHHGCGEPATAS